MRIEEINAQLAKLEEERNDLRLATLRAFLLHVRSVGLVLRQ
jgi:hypothetical protein